MHRIYVDSVIHENEMKEVYKNTKGSLYVYNTNKELSTTLLQRIYDSKSILVTNVYPGVYDTSVILSPIIYGKMKKIVKNRRLLNSIVGVNNNILQYQYNGMEFVEIKEEAEQKAPMQKNTFKRIGNILSSNKHELKVLTDENIKLTKELLILQQERDGLRDEVHMHKNLCAKYTDIIDKYGVDNDELTAEISRLNNVIEEYIHELEELEDVVEKDLIVNIECTPKDKGYKFSCDRLALPFSVSNDKLIFQENYKCRITTPKDISILLSRQSELIQSTAILEKEFIKGDIIKINGESKEEKFYITIKFITL